MLMQLNFFIIKKNKLYGEKLKQLADADATLFLLFLKIKARGIGLWCEFHCYTVTSTNLYFITFDMEHNVAL